MAIKYYKSEYDIGGAVGDEIQSGVLNNLFPDLEADERLNGTTRLRKIWYESDTDLAECYPTIANDSQFYYRVFKSANDDDTVDDLTGNERRYGSLTITDISDSTVTLQLMTSENYGIELFEDGDDVLIGDSKYTVQGDPTDNGDGTISIDVDRNPDTSNDGTLCRSLMPTNGADADTKYPIWIEQVVVAGSAGEGTEHISFNLVI